MLLPWDVWWSGVELFPGAKGVRAWEKDWWWWYEFKVPPWSTSFADTLILSPTQVPIYEKLGFTLHGHKVMPSPWADWQVWFFAKETQMGEAQ